VREERFVWRLGFERASCVRMRIVHCNGVPLSLMSIKWASKINVFPSVMSSLT